MVNKEPLQRRHSHTINRDCVMGGGGGTKTLEMFISVHFPDRLLTLVNQSLTVKIKMLN